MRHTAYILIAIAVVSLLALAPPPVAIAVEGGRFRFEPATVRLRITVEQDPDNRGLIIALHSAGYFRSSYEGLEGDRAARTRWVTYRDVPAGLYQAVAVIERVDGSRAEDIESLTVYERGGY